MVSKTAIESFGIVFTTLVPVAFSSFVRVALGIVDLKPTTRRVASTALLASTLPATFACTIGESVFAPQPARTVAARATATVREKVSFKGGASGRGVGGEKLRVGLRYH